MSSIVICEKPDQAKSVRAAVGNQYGEVYSAVGHILELKEPQEVNPLWAKWNNDLLMPPGGFYPLKKVPSKTKYLNDISSALKTCNTVYICTDPDREGQLIGQEILEYLKYKGKVLRVMAVALDKTTLSKAFQSAVSNTQYQSLYDSAVARQQADQIYNLTLTRVVTNTLVKDKGYIGIGRVRTPTTAIVCKRELEILNFVPKDYFDIALDIASPSENGTVTFAPKDEDKRIADKTVADAVAAVALTYNGPIQVDTKRQEAGPPLLLHITSISKAAGAAWNFKPDHVLDILQSLYETHKITTYPRAEARHLPEIMIGEVPGLLNKLAGIPAYKGLIPASPVIRKGLKGTFSDKALEGLSHHAIIPNINAPDAFDQILPRLTPDESKIFDLICRTYIAALMPNYIYDQTRASIDVVAPVQRKDPFVFSATGRVTVSPGWRRALPKRSGDEDEENDIPPFRNGDIVQGTNVVVLAKQTQPPNRLTLSDLEDAMENAYKFVDDKAEQERLKEAKGIGRPSTRSEILKDLIRRSILIIPSGQKTLIPSDTAMTLYKVMLQHLPDLVDVGTTARMEMLLDDVALGKQRCDKAIEIIAKNAGDMIPKLEGLMRNGIVIPLSAATSQAATVTSKARFGGARGTAKTAANGARKPATFKPGGARKSTTSGTSNGSTKAKATPAAAKTAAPNPNNGNIYFSVSFAQKDAAKGLGMRWDPGVMKWYAPNASIAAEADKHYPRA